MGQLGVNTALPELALCLPSALWWREPPPVLELQLVLMTDELPFKCTAYLDATAVYGN